MPLIAIALGVAAALGGGVAALAHQALPGDVLWGFKVVVNENLQGIAATSAEARAVWNIAVLERRLDEARILAAQGRLSSTAEEQIASNSALHADAVGTLVAHIQASGDARTAALLAGQYQAVLDAGTAALSRTNIVAHLRQKLDAATALSASANAAAVAEAGF